MARLLTLLFLHVGGGPITGEAAATHGATADVLDYGFRFASAIQTDPKSKGREQTRILMIYLSQQREDTARELAHQVEGWWRGVALAEVAVRLASEGRAEEARALIAEAEAVRATIKGWQSPRISVHVAHALALLGDEEGSRKAADIALRDDAEQYGGQVVAGAADGHAARGDFDAAMAELQALDAEKEQMATWWRTSGYIELGKQERFTREQRSKALSAALESARGVPGWQQVDALRLVALELFALGEKATAFEALEAAEELIGPIGGRPTRSPTLLAGVARTWAKIGRPKRARKLLEEAEQSVLGYPNLDRPGLYAQVATAQAARGDEKEAWRLVDLALDSAATLTNARPRATAVVEICRWMGIEKVPLTDAARARLDLLYEGLGDPW